MPAIDTIGFFSTQAGAAAFPTALGAAPGDSLSVRNFPAGQFAQIEALLYSAGGAERVRVVSPNLHDNQTGLTFEPAEIPAAFLLAAPFSVNLQANDTLSVFGGIAGAGTIAGALQVYYSQLPGIQAAARGEFAQGIASPTRAPASRRDRCRR